MKIEKIKPIPKYIEKALRKKDKGCRPSQNGCLRFYSYLTKNDGELVKVTVAVKNRKNKWYAKQVAVHGVHSKLAFVRDIVLHFMGNYSVGWYDMGLYKQEKWYEDGKWYPFEDKYFDPYAPIVNLDYLSKFPEYKYAAWELYKSVDIIKYLRQYEKYPQLEYLMKLGLDLKYVLSKQILVKVAKDKKFRKWLSSHRSELTHGWYYISTVLHAYSQNADIRETQQFENMKKNFVHETDYKPIRAMLNKDYKTYFDYISKQGISHRLYLDYLNACNFLELDMSEDKNRYPHDFKHWHDVRIDEYKTARALKDQQEREELYGQFAAVAEKYLPMQYDRKGCFVAIVARSPAELVNEGKALHHCVGGMNYTQKFVREESLIFFIRAKDTPNIPLVTVEYSISKKRILQCYADGNTTPAADVLHYINKVWLPYTKKQLKAIAA